MATIPPLLAPSDLGHASDEDLSDSVNAGGWQDLKRRASVQRPLSWVFHDGHFKKQAKGMVVQAVCLQKGQHGCRGAM